MSVRTDPKDPQKHIIDYYPLGGKGKRIRIIYRGPRAAALTYELDLRQQNVSETTRKVNPRVKDVLLAYYDWISIHRSPIYLKDIEQAWKNLLPFFGSIKLSRITKSLVNRYKKERPRPTGRYKIYKGTSVINKELRYLGSFHKWAVREGYGSPLPFSIERIPHKRKPPQVFHPSDFEKMLKEFVGKHADKRRALCLLLFECGLRWREASRIKWKNIDWSHGIVYLEDTKGGEPDSCVLTDRIRKLLKPFKKADGWVFVSKKTGKPWQSIRKAMVAAAKSAGVRSIRPHQMRRTGATLMLEATGDMRLVQEWLRHKEIGTTQLYTAVSKERIRRGMALAADHIRQQTTPQAPAPKKDSKKDT